MFWSIFHGNHDHWGVSNVHAWIEKHLYRHFFLSGYFWFVFLVSIFAPGLVPVIGPQ